MKRAGIRFLVAFFFVIAALLAGPASSGAATGRQMASSAIQALDATGSVVWTMNVPSLYWTFSEVSFNYAIDARGTVIDYPLTVSFLGSNFSTPRGIVYLLPGGGMNFRASFFTPTDDSLAQYFRNAGYLVIGITPREDRVPTTASPYSCMKDWGMARHVDDVAEVIACIQNSALFSGRKFRVLGHSFGGSFALDYLDKYDSPMLEKVIALDIYKVSQDEVLDRGSVEIFSDPYSYLGSYADTSYADLKTLMFVSLLLPDVPASPALIPGLPGTFTYEGFLYYSLIESSELEAVELGDWPLRKGYAAGFYDQNAPGDPRDDAYGMSVTSMCTLRDASLKIGSGVVPYAVYRDYFAANAPDYYSDVYFLDWNLPAKVLWLNTEFGYGSQLAAYGAAAVIPGLGHLDVLANKSCVKSACWKYLVQ